MHFPFKDDHTHWPLVFIYENPLLNMSCWEKMHQTYRKHVVHTFWSLLCFCCGLYRHVRDSWTPTEDRWEQMTFPVNTVKHVTVSVKDVNRDTTVSGYTDESQWNCKILSRVSHSLHALTTRISVTLHIQITTL